MILVGHQPEYLPYIGFFSKVAQADAFMFVDHVQYLKKSFQNRNRVRVAPGADGWTWLTVPIKSHDRQFQKITDVEIDVTKAWGEKHWKTIELNYKSTPFFKDYKDFFEDVYKREWEKLADVNETITRYLFKQLLIDVPMYKSSDYTFHGAKTDMIIEMCEAVGADTYLSGVGAKADGYVEEEKFIARGMKHKFANFTHPEYPQKFKPFVPYLSVIDLLFNCGSESATIIRQASYENENY